MASRYSGTQQGIYDRRQQRAQKDRSLEDYNTARDQMKMEAGLTVGKALLSQRTANVAESEARLGIKSKKDVGGIEEGTNLYTDTRETGATTIGGKFKQGAGNLYANVTGKYVEQNPEAIAQVKSQAAGDLTQTDQMTQLYGSTAAEKYMDQFQGERSQPSTFADKAFDHYSERNQGQGLTNRENILDSGITKVSGMDGGSSFLDANKFSQVREANLATSGYQPSNAMLNRMRDDQEATIDAEIGAEQIDTAEGMGISNYQTYKAPPTNTPFDRETLQDAQATGRHTAMTAQMDAKNGGDRTAELKNTVFGDSQTTKYANEASIQETYMKSPEFADAKREAFKPESPNVPVESEEEFFTDDTYLDIDSDDLPPTMPEMSKSMTARANAGAAYE